MPRLRARHMLSAMGIVCCVTGTPMFAAPSPQAPQVTVVRIDGKTESGVWGGINRKSTLTLRDDTGSVAIPLGDVQRIHFHGRDAVAETRAGMPHDDPAEHSGTKSSDEPPPVADASSASVVFYLADGGRLEGRALRGRAEGLAADTILGQGALFPIERLAAVLLTTEPGYGEARREFDEARLHRLRAEDVIISRDREDPRVLRGRVEQFNETEVMFRFAGQSRSVALQKLLGIVFATGGATPPPAPVSIELLDDSLATGRILGGDAEKLLVETSLGITAALPLESIRTITLQSDRIVFLSDLPIAAQHVEGRLHRPWPVRRDQNLRGGPLSIGGRRFERGIACHSRTELTYKLEEPFSAFAATIGIDDLVRPRGSVVFRVLGDGKTLFESTTLTGADEARDILVALDRVTELTLVVDYGEGLDLSDHADWGGARLIRPAKNESGVQ